MIVETSQVTLALVDDKYEHEIPELDRVITGKEIHKQLIDNHLWKNDKDGKYVSLQFNAQEFQFRPARTVDGRHVAGTQLTVGKTVAEALLASSIIIVGKKEDNLNNPAVRYLRVTDQNELGEAKTSGSPTACSICGEDLKTFPRLTRHYEKHKKTHPDLFKTATTYDAPEETEEVEA